MRLKNPRLLLVSQPDSYRLAPYLAAAGRLGLEVLVASRGAHSLVSEVHAGLHVDLDDPGAALEHILDAARQRPFAGVLGCDDSTVELAAHAAQQLDLPHNPPRAARESRRKDLARARLARAGCAVPAHRLIDLERPVLPQIEGLRWPCVLKPIHLSASRGVIRADDEAGFVAACERIRGIIAGSGEDFETRHLLVEDYIDGVEVAWEGYLRRGKLHTLALFDKPDPLQGPFFEETIYVTPSLLAPETQQKIRQRVAQACRALGLDTGPVHAELRIDGHDAWILEVATRTIGGDCARVLDDAGFNLEELAISLAIDTPHRASPPQGARGVMMIPVRRGGILRRVEGILAARRVPLVERVDILVREGQELVPLPEGNRYPGYIFARGESPQEVTRALRTACARLDFVVAPLLRMEKIGH